MHYKYSEVLSKERKRISGVSKVNAFFDGLKILINIFKLKINLTFGGYGKNWTCDLYDVNVAFYHWTTCPYLEDLLTKSNNLIYRKQ